MRQGCDRPATLRAASVLWLVLAGLLLATVLVDIGVSAYASVSAPDTLSAQLAFGVLTLVFALRMRAGRNWARIALVVCGALFMLAAVDLARAADMGVPGWIIIVVTLLALVAAAGIALMYAPASNEYFRSSRGRRKVRDDGAG